MTREQFFETLEVNGIDKNIVSFDDSIKEGHGIRQNYHRWETFIRERGQEYNVIGYPSESDALIALSEQLIGIYGKK
jgi:hypothetical protein